MESLKIRASLPNIKKYIWHKALEKNIPDVVKKDKELELFYEKDREDMIGEVIAETVIECFYPLYIGECIKKHNNNTSDIIKTKVIIKSIKKIWCEDEKLRKSYMSCIKKRFFDCVKNNNKFNFDGFVTFRIKDFTKHWKHSIINLIENEILDCERKSCLQRIKMFLWYAPSKIETLVVEEEISGYLVFEKGSGIKQYVFEKPKIIDIIVEKVPQYVELVLKEKNQDSILSLLYYLLEARLTVIDN